MNRVRMPRIVMCNVLNKFMFVKTLCRLGVLLALWGVPFLATGQVKPTIQFAQTNITIVEGSSNALVVMCQYVTNASVTLGVQQLTANGLNQVSSWPPAGGLTYTFASNNTWTIPLSTIYNARDQGTMILKFFLTNVINGILTVQSNVAWVNITDTDVVWRLMGDPNGMAQVNGAGTVSVSEQEQYVLFRLSRTGNLNATNSVTVTATPPGPNWSLNWRFTTNMFVWKPGCSNYTISIPIFWSAATGNRTFTLALTTPDAGSRIDPAAASVVVTLADYVPLGAAWFRFATGPNVIGGNINWNWTNFTRVEEDAGTVNVAVERMGDMAGGYDAYYTTITYDCLNYHKPGLTNAQNTIGDADYQLADGILNFGANVRYINIPIPINNDRFVELDKVAEILIYDTGPKPGQPADVVGVRTYGTVRAPGVYGAWGEFLFTIHFDDQPAGAFDRRYNPFDRRLNQNQPGADQPVCAVAVDDQGRTVIGGEFQNVNSSPINGISRLLVDGTLDTTFAAGSGADGNVYALAIYPTTSTNNAGKILVGGEFSSINGVPRNGIARLNKDGSLDTTFAPGNGIQGNIYGDPNRRAAVHSITIMNNDTAVIGGDFSLFNNFSRNGVARLKADGSLDETFDPGSGADGPVWTVAQEDTVPILLNGSQSGAGPMEWRTNLNTGASSGTITLDYDFYTVPDTIHIYYDGTLIYDSGLVGGTNHVVIPYGPGSSTSLDFVMNEGGGDPFTVWDFSATIVTAGGSKKVLLGGEFLNVGTYSRPGVARLNGNGTVDTLFTPGKGADGPVYAIKVPSPGQILVAGNFASMGVTPRRSIARLDNYGNVDPAFDPGQGVDGSVYAMVVQNNGQAIIAGDFRFYNGTGRTNIARLFNDGTLDTTFLDTYYNQWLPGLYYLDDNNNIVPGYVNALSLQTNGHLMVGGRFDFGGGGATIVGYAPVEGGPNTYNTNLLNDVNSMHTNRNFTRIIGGDMLVGGGQTNAPGNIELVDDAYSVMENAAYVTITLHRINGRLGTAQVPVYTRDSSGIAGRDYVQFATTVTWPISANDIQEIQIPILNNTNRDGNREFEIVLGQPAWYWPDPSTAPILQLTAIPPGTAGYVSSGIPNPALGFRSTSRVTILDDDALPGTITFANPVYYVNEGTNYASIMVVRTNGADKRVDVNVMATSGTATNGVDYQWNYTWASPYKLTFSPNVTTQFFSVRIIDNLIKQPEHTLKLSLFGASGGAGLGRTNATLVIVDNDNSPGSLSFVSDSFQALESDGALTIPVMRTGGATGLVSVAYAMIGTGLNPAQQGLDYLNPLASGVLWFSNGVTVNTNISIVISNRLGIQGDRTLTLFLSAPGGGSYLGFQNNTTLLIKDTDRYGQLSFSRPRYAVNEKQVSLGIDVVRSGGSYSNVAVTIAPFTDYQPFSAIPGVNFLPVFTNLVWTQGDTSVKTFYLPILYTNSVDGNKTLSVLMLNLTNATLGDITNASVLIVDAESQNVPAGSVDTSFNPDPGMDGYVQAITLQNDGKILVGGSFTSVNGIGRSRIARMAVNGVLDGTFDPLDGANDSVQAIAVQTDGRILLGGRFTTFASTNRNRIVRLNADGRMDPSFDPGAGADNPVYALDVWKDGRIAVGGSFVNFRGFTRPAVAVLNTNGSVRLLFNADGQGPNAVVRALAFQPDGKLLIAGDFTYYKNQPVGHVARLNDDGSLDTSFNAGGVGTDGTIYALDIDYNGRIIIGGLFTSVNGVRRNNLARLNSDGTLDTSFLPTAAEIGANGAVFAISLQSDGKVVVTGDFTRFNNVSRNRITRLFDDGTTDPTINFGTGANAFIAAVANQTDDQIIIGGGFTSFNESHRNYLARLIGYQNLGSGQLEFLKPEFTFYESQTNAVITVRRNGGTSNTVAMGFSTLTNVFANYTPAVSNVDYIDTNGVLVFPQGETLQTFTVLLISHNVPAPTKALTLQLSTNVPGGGALDLQSSANLVIVDDHAVIGFSSPVYTVNENDVSGYAVIPIWRMSGTNTDVQVQAFTTNGTATSGLDYLSTNRAVAFAPGQTNALFLVKIIRNYGVTGNRTVTLSLSSTPGTTVFFGQATAQLTIVDVDTAPGTFNFATNQLSVFQYETNTTVYVIRTNGSSGFATVDFSTEGGTAAVGLDYTPVSGTLAFGDGETVKSFNIPIKQNYQMGTNTTVSLRLKNPTGPTGIALGDDQAKLTIIQSDLINGSLTFDAPSYTVSETNTNGFATITVKRQFGNLGNISVAYSTGTNGSAIVGSNYWPTNGLLHWTNGEVAVKSFQVQVISNNLVEGDKTVWLQIALPTGGASLGLYSNATLVVHDESNGPGMLSFAKAQFSALKSASNAVITVTRTNGNLGTVSVNYATTDGSALNGTHYQSVSGTLVLTNGQVSNTFAVPLLFPSGTDLDKLVNLHLSNPTNATLVGLSNATLVIQEVGSVAGSVDSYFQAAVDGPINVVLVSTNVTGVTTNIELLIAGEFTTVNGVPSAKVARIARNSGDVDTTFSVTNTPNGGVRAMAALDDGSVLIGGTFTNMGGLITNVVGPIRTVVGRMPRYYLAKLTASGLVDAAFIPTNALDNVVNAIALQMDGKILIGGAFTTIYGQTRNYLARLNTDGTLDASFAPLIGANGAAGTVHVIAVDNNNNGRIIIGGDFTTVNNVTNSGIACLNRDGTLVANFNTGSGADGSVRTIVIQPDSSILLGGLFLNVNGVSRSRIARLTATGALDYSFDPGLGMDQPVASLALQSDGRIFAAGTFVTVNGIPRSRLTRLMANGSVDPSFNIGLGADNYINTVALPPGLKVVIGGGFTNFNQTPVAYLAQLNNGTNVGTGGFGFASPNYAIGEGGTNATITVLRFTGVSGTASVSYGVRDGTGVAGVNYSPVSGVLNFASGELIKTFTVPVLDDGLPDGDHTVNLFLYGPTGGAELKAQSNAVLTVIENRSLVEFTTTGYGITKGNTNVAIQIQRKAGYQGVASVLFSTMGGTAAAGVDYVPTNIVVTFTNGQANAVANVRLLNNTNVTGDLTVLLALSNPVNATMGISNATLTLVERSIGPGVFSFAYTNMNVDEATGTVSVAVLRRSGALGNATVNYSTVSLSATPNQDYVPTNGLLIFADGEVSKTIQFQVIHNYIPEGNVTLQLVLSNATGGASLSRSASTSLVTILDIDLSPGSIAFGATTNLFSETNGFAIISVNRFQGSVGPVSVNYATTTNGNAVPGGNYWPTNGVVSWAAGDVAVKTFLVPLINSPTVDGDVSVGLTLSNVQGGALLGALSNSWLIVHDESTGIGKVTFAAINYVTTETNINAVIAVLRTNGTVGTVSANYATSDGTATNGVNYLAVSGTLTFTNGQTSNGFLVPLISRPGTDVSKNLNLRLSNFTNATPGLITNATLTILDGDPAAGSVDNNFQVSLDGPVNRLTVMPSVGNQITIVGDFTMVNGQPMNRVARLFPDGTLNATFQAGGGGNGPGGQVRALATYGDGRVMIGGAFTHISGTSRNYLARLLNNGSLDTNFMASVTGPDSVVNAVALQADGQILIGGLFASVNGQSQNYLARLNPDGTLDNTFTCNISGSVAAGAVRAIQVQPDGRILIGGDFVLVNGVARNRIARLYPDGSLDASFDPGAGADDSVRVVLAQPDGKILLGGLFLSVSGNSRARIARLNADGSSDASFNPGSGANEYVLSLALQVDGKILVGGGFTAINGYPRNNLARLMSNGAIDTTYNVGTGADNYINVVALQPDQKVLIGGGFTSFDRVAAPYLARLNGGTNLGTGAFEFAATNYVVNENGSNATITVVRTLGVSGLTTVAYGMSNGTAVAGVNYLAVSGTLTFADGETIKTFTVPILDDHTSTSNRTINLFLANPTGGAQLATQSTAVLTIIESMGVIGFDRATYSVTSGASFTTINVVRAASSIGLATVDFTTTDGSAVAMQDYWPVSGTITFLPGETNVTVYILLINNPVAGDRTINLSLFNPTNASLSISNATLTIVDRNPGPGSIGFSVANYSTHENSGFANITVQRLGGSLGNVSVDFGINVAAGNATVGLDYQMTNGTLRFADGETVKTFTVPVMNDNMAAGDKTVVLTLANPSGGATLNPSLSTAVLTIIDDDVMPGSFVFTTNGYYVVEGYTYALISVLRTNGGSGTVSVNFATIPGGTAVDGVDYVGSSATLVFTNKEMSKDLYIPIMDNPAVDPTKTVLLRLFNPVGGATLGTPSDAVLYILENQAVLNFSQSNYSVLEGGGSVTVTVIRSNSTFGTVSVDYSTGGGTANSGTDYTPVNGTLVFNYGETIKSFTVPIIDNSYTNANKTINLSLSKIVGSAMPGSQANSMITILDDDSVVSLDSTNYTVRESGGQLPVTITRTGSVNGPASVNVVTTNGTALAGVHFVGTNQTVFFAAGETLKVAYLQIIDNKVSQGNRTFGINLTQPSAGTTVASGSGGASIMILDDYVPILVPVSAALVSENLITNGVIDPGETVTLNLSLRNLGRLPATNLVATLLATNGISLGTTNTMQAYGTLGYLATASRPFTFTVTAAKGTLLPITLSLTNGSTNFGTVTFTFIVGEGSVRFVNSNPITITSPAIGTAQSPANPYPSPISVSGISGIITKVTVTLSNLSHTSPRDMEIMLVGPQGQRSVLMSQTIGNLTGLTNATLTFDDAAGALPQSGYVPGGTYRPTSYGSIGFAAPAPSGAVTNLAVFNGTDPNGTWLLYVQDDMQYDDGLMAKGWAINVQYQQKLVANADLEVKAYSSPAPVVATSNLTYYITVTNNGPSAASGVKLTNTLPVGAVLISSNLTTGSFSVNAGQVVANVGNLAIGGGAQMLLVVQVPFAGVATNTIVVSGSLNDPVLDNNVATTLTLVKSLPPVLRTLLSSGNIRSGGLQLGFSGSPGMMFYIDNTTTLTNWTRIATNVMTGSSTNIAIDPKWLTGQKGFFRIVVP